MSDLIDRQAAIDALIRKKQPVNNNDGSVTITILTDSVIKDVLKELPSAEREKGRWEVAIGYDPKRSVMCSECRRMSYEPTPFCPNCGAEMENSDEL